MARHQFSVPSSTHDGKKTRKERKAELKASQEEFARQQQQQQAAMGQQAPGAVEAPLIDTAEDQEQMRKLITWGGIISVALLALMYFIFVF